MKSVEVGSRNLKKPGTSKATTGCGDPTPTRMGARNRAVLSAGRFSDGIGLHHIGESSTPNQRKDTGSINVNHSVSQVVSLHLGAPGLKLDRLHVDWGANRGIPAGK